MEEYTERVNGLRVTGAEDCGNAPKKGYLRAFTIHWALNDKPFLADCCTDQAAWEIVGNRRFEGKGEWMAATFMNGKAEALDIASIITHGYTGSIDGTVTFADGGKLAFCHVCAFNSAGKKAKLKSIRSYLIDIPRT